MKNIFIYSHNPPKETFDLSPAQSPRREEPMGKVNCDLDINKAYVNRLFTLSKNNDIVTRDFFISAGGKKIGAYLICVEGLSNMSFINDFILRSLMEPNEEIKGSMEEFIKKTLVPQAQFTIMENIDTALQTVNIGNAVLFADGLDKCFSMDVKSWEHRSVSSPENESVIQGPHEGFNEVLRCNTALIRKTLNTPELIMENIAVGRTSRTPGALVYINNVTNDSLVREVRRRITSIDAEYVLTSLDVEQYIEDDSFLPVPQMITTERPDRVCRALTEGRVAFVLNGSPHALIMPATFFDLITSAEDGYLRYPYSLLIRILRYLAVFLALILPGLFASVLNFHPELLITNILLTVSSSRALVPFGAFMELLLLEIAFELIKEAGIRIPGPIGSTLGIVGGLIVGQAAVEANLVSPIMIIIVAITGISSFTLPSYSLSFAFRFSRFLYIFGAMLGGIYGLSFVFFVNTLIAIGVKSFGVPFMSPLSPVDGSNRFNLIVGAPIWKRGTRREDYLKPRDMYKKSSISCKWRE